MISDFILARKQKYKEINKLECELRMKSAVKPPKLVLSISNCPDNCFDFRYENNGMLVLGVGFFFFRQISTFKLAILDGIF